MDDQELRHIFQQANQATADALNSIWLDNAINNMRTHGKALGYSNTHIYKSIKYLEKWLNANKGQGVSS